MTEEEFPRKTEVVDTHEHITAVRGLLLGAVGEILERAHSHDCTKLIEPELSKLTAHRRKLDEIEHDSPEYYEQLDQMGEGLGHHYRHNTHHPEHFENGFLDMDVLDILELCCDWVAASARTGGDVEEYIRNGARERYGYDATTARLLLLTVRAVQSLAVPQRTNIGDARGV